MQQQPSYGHHTAQPVLVGTTSKNKKTLSMQSVTTRMPLLMATNMFVFRLRENTTVLFTGITNNTSVLSENNNNKIAQAALPRCHILPHVTLHHPISPKNVSLPTGRNLTPSNIWYL